MKIEGGSGKQPLRQLLFREVPPQLFDRPKTGFAIPVGEWLKGPLRPWAEELICPARLRAEGRAQAAHEEPGADEVPERHRDEEQHRQQRRPAPGAWRAPR